MSKKSYNSHNRRAFFTAIGITALILVMPLAVIFAEYSQNSMYSYAAYNKNVHASTSQQKNIYANNVGINTSGAWISEASLVNIYKPMRAAGVTWSREDFFAGYAQSQDNILQAAKQTGMNILGIIIDKNYSTNTGFSNGGNDAYTSPATYTQECLTILANAKAQGEPLTAVELWNEPWGDWSVANPNVKAYAAMVKPAIAAIHANYPGVTVLISGDYMIYGGNNNGQQWLSALTPLVTPDAWSIHPYPAPKNLSPTNVADSPQDSVEGQIQLAESHAKNIPIWITELGWSTGTGSDQVTAAQQASYQQQAITYALNQSEIKKYFIYSADVDDPSQGDPEGYFGAFYQNGSPKPIIAMLSNLLN